jgi:hypothetical protein
MSTQPIEPPSDTFAEKISNLLQQSWDSEATGIQVSEINWSHAKFETMREISNVNQKVIISTYNPTNPVSCEALSAQTNFVHEIIVIDVILQTQPFGSTDNCITARVAIKKLITTVIHEVELQTGLSLPGADSILIEGEFVCGELPDIQREAYKAVVNYFEVLS